MPDLSVPPTLDLQLAWRGATGRLRAFRDHVTAETSYERDAVTAVPMSAVVGWRIEPCDDMAVCVEFVTGDDVYRVLLGMRDEGLAALALRRVLGEPLPGASA